MDTVEQAILTAIRLGRLVGAQVTKEQIHSAWALYRVEDDLQLNNYSSLSREHAILATEDDKSECSAELRESIDSWAYRYGVASMSIVCKDSLPTAIAELSTNRMLPVHTLSEQQSAKPQRLVFPFDDADQLLRLANAQVEHGPTPDNEIKLLFPAAFRYIVKSYCSEAPLIEYEIGERGSSDEKDRGYVMTSEGDYEVSHVSASLKRHTYYRFWRIGVMARYKRASRLLEEIRSTPAACNGWPRDDLMEALSSLRKYLGELLCGTRLVEAAHGLNRALDSLRTESSLKPIFEEIQEAFLLDGCKMVEMLGRFRAPGALAALAQALDSPEKEMRLCAVRALSSLRNNDDGAAHLRRALKDPNNRVRLAAINGLGNFRESLRVPTLVEFFPSANPEERAAILHVLGSSESLMAFEVLLQSLLSTDETLADLSRWPVREFLVQPGMADRVMYWYKQLPALRRKQLIEQLCERSEAVGDDASVQVLAVFQDAEAVPALLRIIEAADDLEGFEAARALGKIGGERAAEGLARVLEQRCGKVPWSLVEAVGKLRVKRCYSGLIGLLEEGRWQSQAIEALGLLGEKGAIPSIVAAHAKHSYLASEAAEALRRLGAEDEADKIAATVSREQVRTTRNGSLHIRYPGGEEYITCSWS